MGLHKWRNGGERVLVSRPEPPYSVGAMSNDRFRAGMPKGQHAREQRLECKSEVVFSERECLRCGIKERRLFSEDAEGNKAPAGWERIN